MARLLSLLRFALLVGGALGAALYALSAAKAVPQLSDQQIYGCVAVVAASAIVQPFLQGLGAARRLRRERDLSLALRQVIATVLNECQAVPIAWNAVGTHFFVVRRSLPAFWRSRLVDIGHERLDNRGKPSVLKFSKGKGVVGTCWKTREDQGLDLKADLQQFQTLTAEKWNGVPDTTKLGLTWAEYEQTRTIEAVAAYVARDRSGSKVVGVVSVEAPTGSLTCLLAPAAAGYIGHIADDVVEALGRR